MSPVVTTRTPDELREAWNEIRDREPKIRIRNAARELGVSEAELLATRCGDGVRRLICDVARTLPRLEGLGPLMALTRNDLFVHEKTGLYRNVEVGHHASQVVDEDIDLRIFQGRWHHAFAVSTESRGGVRRSLQFFDTHGEAVHKIFLTDESDLEAYEALVEDLLHDDPSRELTVEPPPEPTRPGPDSEVDLASLEEGWRTMQDTHDFFHLLRKAEVTRTQALRLVPEELARPAANSGLRTVLEAAARDGIDLMVFVQSPGTFQIHHGPVVCIVDTPPWLNVLDQGFNLHVRERGIAATWVVTKPTETGWVTSLELYDAADTLCALIFGCRQEGEPENPAWRTLARGLARPGRPPEPEAA